MRSRGFRSVGQKAARKVRIFADSQGLDLSAHRSDHIQREDVEWATHIIYMDGGNWKRLVAFMESEDCRDNTRQDYVPLGEAIGLSRIADPNFLPSDSKALQDLLLLVVQAAEATAAQLLASLQGRQPASPPSLQAP